MFTLAGDAASLCFIPRDPSLASGGGHDRQPPPASPVQDHADIAGHAVGVVQDLSPQLVAEGTQILVPGLVGLLGEAGQCFVPVRIEVVDRPPAVRTELAGEAEYLDFLLAALGRPAYRRGDPRLGFRVDVLVQEGLINILLLRLRPSSDARAAWRSSAISLSSVILRSSSGLISPSNFSEPGSVMDSLPVW